jgi:uncharacterized glyoxalase superfamily protein PhnB
MEIVYETNGKGVLGWIVELPGAYIRGKTIDEAKDKINNEIIEYKKWLDLPYTMEYITEETIIQSKLAIEDADSNILLDYDIDDYETPEGLKSDCKLVLISANKVNEIYRRCNYKNAIDKTKIRKTFYGDVYSTIEKQYIHIINVQRYYLNNICTDTETGMEIIDGRIKTIEKINEKYIESRNKIYKTPEENWTIRKVIRRLIWHDRIHAKAIKRMEKRIAEELKT